MDVKDKEIRRYITLEFNENDLKELSKEIDGFNKWFLDSPYSTNRDQLEKYKKLNEFNQVIKSSLDLIHS